MIRYPISAAELKKAVEAESPGWLKASAHRTARFRKLGRYRETSTAWSKVKVVYMRLQGDCKCAYCERKLESEEYGKGEQDVEHFRPKSRVGEWTSAGIPITPPPAKKGYYLLPYHIFNYAAACKPCNSALKSDAFPIAGTYNLDGDDPFSLRREKPYLLYPVGDVDEDDPEKVIRFVGASPCPVAARGHRRNRALVTIEFFKLDDVVGRKNLFRERAMIILALFPSLVAAAQASGSAECLMARELVKAYTGPSAPHTNCARSFVALFGRDRRFAKVIFEAAQKFVASQS